MENYELERMGVRELRRVCKENGKKNYAWLKKVELIFLIQDYSTSCGNCDGNLTIEEMQKYLDNPDECQGMNTYDEYLPCCSNCFQNEQSPCYICEEIYMNNSLEWAILEDGGEERVCEHCARCSECWELITVMNDGGIQQENWFDGELFCSDCIEVECDGCNQAFHKDTVIWGYSDKDEGICLCEECNVCSDCGDPLDTIDGLNIKEKFYCYLCEPTPCHFCKEKTRYSDTLTGVGPDGNEIDICKGCNECSMCKKPLNKLNKYSWDWESDLLCDKCPPYTCRCGKIFTKEEQDMIMKILPISKKYEPAWNSSCICNKDTLLKKALNALDLLDEWKLKMDNKEHNNYIKRIEKAIIYILLRP
jgi:hypothetical protein